MNSSKSAEKYREPLGKEEMSELMQLDEKYRIPIVLHEIEGYSAKEIGKILDLSETNVRNRLFRGKAVLREKLEGVI